MQLVFESLAEDQPGPRWQGWFRELWPLFRKWYLAEGNAARPTYLECERALRTHMPAFVPTWERLVELAGGGDVEARFLSLYCPPPYLSGCSQAVWTNPGPILVRNYDYSPFLTEKLVWRTVWNNRAVIASTDCLVGVLDGINGAGLAVSLSFGGSRETGTGFGAPMVVRYLLEFCENVHEAADVLRRIPVHMAYNIMMLDADGDYLTAFTTPDGPTIIRRTPATTNHQDRVAWPRHAEATATLERERRLFELLGNRKLSQADIVARFLKPPLYQTEYARGYGTLYTAVYNTASRTAEFIWPDNRWTLPMSGFEDRTYTFNVADSSSDDSIAALG